MLGADTLQALWGVHPKLKYLRPMFFTDDADLNFIHQCSSLIFSHLDWMGLINAAH